MNIDRVVLPSTPILRGAEVCESPNGRLRAAFRREISFQAERRKSPSKALVIVIIHVFVFLEIRFSKNTNSCYRFSSTFSAPSPRPMALRFETARSARPPRRRTARPAAGFPPLVSPTAANPRAAPEPSRCVPSPEAAEQIPQRSRRCPPSGFARKWRRKGLKRLNPRPEMVWSRKARTPNIWYKSASDGSPSTVSSPSRATNATRGRGGRKFSWLQSLEKSRNAERISPEPAHGTTHSRSRR
jgi:hypothetical protein